MTDITVSYFTSNSISSINDLDSDSSTVDITTLSICYSLLSLETNISTTTSSSTVMSYNCSSLLKRGSLHLSDVKCGRYQLTVLIVENIDQGNIITIATFIITSTTTDTTTNTVTTTTNSTTTADTQTYLSASSNQVAEDIEIKVSSS